MANLQINNLFGVTGRWVAITGGARGFTANGANTILIDYDEKGLQQAKSDLEVLSKSNNCSIITICADLSTEEGVQSAVQSVKSIRTSLDALIHCAAIRYMNKIAFKRGDDLDALEKATSSTPYDGWEHSFRLNVLAPYFLTAGLITLLGSAAAQGEGRGCVILFSSPASVHNNQFVPCYQTSKAAVDHLTRILAAEFADFYIRVNAISPGIVPSKMTPDDGTSNLRLAAEAPAGRAGSEEDMVGTALWLASRAGEFMDGKVVRAEGGRLLILKGVTSNSD